MDIDPSTGIAEAGSPNIPENTTSDDDDIIKIPDISSSTIDQRAINQSLLQLQGSSIVEFRDSSLSGKGCSSTNTDEDGSSSEPLSQETNDAASFGDPVTLNMKDSSNGSDPLDSEGLSNHPGHSNTNNGEIPSEQEITYDSQAIFKLPNVPIARKRPSVSTKEDVPSKKSKTASNKTDTESEIQTDQTVNIFTEVTGPQWYEVHNNIQNITKTIVPSRLRAAFKLPDFGRPVSYSDLDPYYEHNAKEFFKGTQFSADAYDDARNSVSDCIFKLRSKLVPVQICIPVPGMSNDDMMVMKPKHIVAAEEDLNINNMYRIRKENDQNHIFIKKMKYRGIRLLPLLKEDEKDEPEMLNPGRDLMFHVRIYRPFTYNKQKSHTRGRHSVFARDLLLSGRHKLSDLRDSFLCPNDMDMRLDISERINEAHPTTAKDLFPAGFLFINNVFYVDRRNGSRDISTRIREWAIKKGIGTFPCKDMGKLTLEQIHLKLGHPEVYVHQGNCEHLFTFSEIRLVNASDPLNLSHYPCHTAISQNQTVYCTACADYAAKYIVTGCERVPFDPAFFCDTCLKYYLYKAGLKIGSFKAYSYRGNEMHSLKLQG
ncbi:hypothetical protein O0L34_g15278 [Tuta absoluta]|nr:hypothetical protein O0L34_g15278 [Tuta absoluta]